MLWFSMCYSIFHDFSLTSTRSGYKGQSGATTGVKTADTVNRKLDVEREGSLGACV